MGWIFGISGVFRTLKGPSHFETAPFIYGADNRSPAASPCGLALVPLASLIPQARFEHRLLERSQDVLAYADVFSGRDTPRSEADWLGGANACERSEF